MNNYTEEELVERWEEIAAIREFDGEMTRQAAERAALFDLRREVGMDVPVPKAIQSIRSKST